MAQPPPPPNPPVLPPPPAAIAINPKTYLSLYDKQPDVLNGQYAGLFAEFLTTNNPVAQPQTLRENVLGSSKAVPSVFLCLIQDAAGTYTSRTVHRLTSFPRSTIPALATGWDGKGFAFASDVRPGNQISLVTIPERAFHQTPNANLLDIAAITAAIGPGVAGAPELVPPPAAGAAGIRQLRSRYFVRVPKAYIPLVLGQRLSPRDLWNTLGAAIVADNRAADFAHLLDWLALAVTARTDPADPQGAHLPPAVTLTGAAGAAVPLSYPEIDDALQAFVWDILKTDLPALDPSSLSPTDQVLALIGVMRDDNAKRDAAAVADRQARAGEKLPSKTFPAMTEQWLRLTEMQTEATLPDLYHRWANCTKGERRTILERLVTDRARTPGAATAIPPIVTKEVYELVFSGAFGPTEHEVDNLAKGFQPFVTAFTTTQDREVLSARAASYDLLMQGEIRPSLSETVALATTAVAIPSNTHEARSALAGLSIISDVVLGVNHRFSAELRDRFLLRLWPQIEHTLYAISTPDNNLKETLIPGLMRWCQIHMGLYFRLLSAGASPPLPSFDALYNIVATRTYQNLPALPEAYIARPPATPTPAPATQTPSTRPAATPPASSAPPAQPPAAASGIRGNIVNNTSLNASWKQAYDNAGIRVQALRDMSDRPTARRDGRDVDICLAYHLRGMCFDNCSRSATHGNLSAAEKTKVQTFVANRLARSSSAPAQSA